MPWARAARAPKLVRAPVPRIRVHDFKESLLLRRALESGAWNAEHAVHRVVAVVALTVVPTAAGSIGTEVCVSLTSVTRCAGYANDLTVSGCASQTFNPPAGLVVTPVGITHCA